MFSRHSFIKHSLKPALNFIKVDSAAHIHLICYQKLKLTSAVSRSTSFNSNRQNLLSACWQKRYQSSSSTLTNEVASEHSAGLDPLPEPPALLPEITHPAVEGFSSEPSLSSLGLGNFTPAGFVQNGLEYLHVAFDLPWWGAVVCGTVIIRILMFPVVIISQRNAAILHNNLPQVQHFQVKITEARQRGDKLDAARYTAEMMNFMNVKNFNPMKNMMPPLFQAPVFLSCFVGLRAMANLPVESLKTGGTFWFVDLTVPDQFYILPVVTSLTLYLTLKLGADTAQSTKNAVLMKYLFYGLPAVLLPFTFNFPGLMLVYWTMSNFIALAQVGFLRIPKVRDFFKIDKKINHVEEEMPVKDKGFVNNVKDAWTNIKLSSELQERERVDRINFLRAGREPIQKTYKYDPTQVRQGSTAVQAKKKS